MQRKQRHEFIFCEKKTAGLRAAIEARNEADAMIREEMKGLGYQSPFISWRNVGSLA